MEGKRKFYSSNILAFPSNPRRTWYPPSPLLTGNPLTFENDSSALERVAFLAEDRSFFFVELLEEKVVTVHKLPPVQIDSFGSLMFPDDIMKVNLDQDGDEELLLWYTEAEEPPALFKLAIFEPLSKGKNLELLIETPPLFPYPSYDPFTPPKSIVIKKNMITIPHCTGCESGREGTEEKAFLKYKNSTYSFGE